MQRVALLAILVLVPACSLGGDGDGGAINAEELAGLVLQPADVSPQFQRFDEGRQAPEDAPAGRRADPARFGRIDGWKARYTRPGSPRTQGPLVLESRVDAFEEPAGAADDLAAFQPAGYRELDAIELGDGARAFETLQPGVGRGVRYYLVVWREENATASVLASGFEGRFTLMDVVGLARKQAARVERAAS